MTNDEIRAALLKDYGYEINENNELFFLIKLLYVNDNNFSVMVSDMKQTVTELNSNIQKKKIQQVYFENSKQAFWNGFGKIGLSLITAIFCITFLVVKYVPKYTAPTNDASYAEFNRFMQYQLEKNPKVWRQLVNEYITNEKDTVFLNQ